MTSNRHLGDMRDPDDRMPGNEDQRSKESLLYVATVLLRNRRLILFLIVAIPTAVLVDSLLTPRTWTTTASFTPQSGGDQVPSRLSDLAGQFGFQIGGGDAAGQSPEFYADLIRSREVLGPIALDTFEVGDTVGLFSEGHLRSALPDLIGLEDGPTGVRRQLAVSWLREEAVTVSTGRETGLVKITVTTPWPELSQQVAISIIERVNEFNLQTRQSQAAQEREFVEDRVQDARQALRAAENSLQSFLINNRRFQNSPELVFEHDRLQREVSMRQQVYTSLVQSFEQARIAEVRNIPVLTVVERPEDPARPDRRGLRLKLILSVFVATGLAVMTALVRDHISQVRRSDSATAGELKDLWRQTLESLPFRGSPHD